MTHRITRFEEAAQNVMQMSVMVAFCIAGYLEGAGIHEFTDDELKDFMMTTSKDIENWLKQESQTGTTGENQE